MAGKNDKGAGGTDDESAERDDDIQETDDQTQDDDASGDDDEGKGKSVSRSTYKKTVAEAKRAKEKLRKIAEENEALKAKALEGETNKDEKIKSLSKALADSAKRNKELMGSTVKKALSDQVKAEAAKAGCLHPDKVMRLIDLSDVDVDSETLEADSGLIAEKLTDLRKEMPQLFKKAAPKINGKMPKGDGGEDDVQQKEDLSKLTKEQLRERLRDFDRKR